MILALEGGAAAGMAGDDGAVGEVEELFGGLVAEVGEIVDDAVLVEGMDESAACGGERAGSGVSARVSGALVPCHPDEAKSLGVPPSDFFGMTDRICAFHRKQDLRSSGGLIEVFAVGDQVDDTGLLPELIHGELT